MGYESEAMLENKLIETLAKNGYERITINDEKSMIDNFLITLKNERVF